MIPALSGCYACFRPVVIQVLPVLFICLLLFSGSTLFPYCISGFLQTGSTSTIVSFWYHWYRLRQSLYQSIKKVYEGAESVVWGDASGTSASELAGKVPDRRKGNAGPRSGLGCQTALTVRQGARIPHRRLQVRLCLTISEDPGQSPATAEPFRNQVNALRFVLRFYCAGTGADCAGAEVDRWADCAAAASLLPGIL